MLKKLLPLLIFLISSQLFSQSFTSIWDTNNTSSGSSGTNEITIPTNPGYTTYNYNVDWGDGNTDSGITGNITHTYATPGTYTINISGTFPAIYFNNTSDKLKIIEILDWGNIQWQTMENAFYGCANLNFDAINSPDLSQVTSLKETFRGCTSFNGIVNNWDVSNITNMAGLFRGAVIFNRPLDSWNTISVTDMSDTFNTAQAYNEPLDNWNVASVTNMAGMFSGAGNFNQNINNWDVSQVTNMSATFQSTNRFNLPLNNWNVSNVTDMSNMFFSSSFNQAIGNWSVSNVTDMSGMFGQSQFNQPIQNWDVSNVTDMSQMFFRHRTFDQPINNWDVSNVTNMAGMFDGWIWDGVFNQPLDNWDVGNVTDMSYMFRDTNNFNQDISGWDVSAVTNMKGMFKEARAFNQDISSWVVSSVTDMSEMFQQAPLYNQPLNSWDVGNVTLMNNMFLGAVVFDQPLNSWTVGQVTNMNSMFRGAPVFNQSLGNWNTSNVLDMARMFENASDFDQNLATWNIGNVTNMAEMLSHSGLSQTNFDNSLIGWAGQTVQTNVSLGATSLNYCDGRNERQQLIDNANWTITGDIINCSFVLCTSLVSPLNGDTNVPSNANLIWESVPGATGYRITVRRENGGSTQVLFNNEDVGNVVGVDFTSDLNPGDEVFVTIVPYNDTDGPAVGCTEESFTVVPSWINSTEAFKLTYDTSLTDYKSTPANQLKISANTGYPGYLTYDYSIDWGDDQFNNNVTGDITHTYLTPGVYTVTIIGTFPAPYHYYSNSDSIKLLSIDQWGTQPWESMELAFYGCSNMEYNATDIPDLTNVTTMSNMFGSCASFNGNIDNWDVSNVTNMYGLFLAATTFNQPLNNWDVSNVTNMSAMFLVTSAFNQPLNNWDTGNVTNMADMFRQATGFNQNIESWDVGNVTNMSSMFERAELFNQPLNSWNVGNVTDMSQMFDGYVIDMDFNQPLSSWNVGNVTNMQAMFRRSTAFNQNIDTWNVSNVLDMSYMFQDTDIFNQPLNSWDVSKVNNMQYMFYDARSFDQNINSWNVTNVTNMRGMFQSAITFDQAVGNWDVNSVVNMQSMFQSASSFNQPLDVWDVSAVANMASMFESAVSFDQPLNNWDVSSVTLMNSMFETASLFNGSTGNWDVGSVTNMEAMFKDAILFNQPMGNWDTGELLNAKEMFRGAQAFNQNIDSWNTSFVTTMEAMFQNATTFNQPINSWNVASVTTMLSMFHGAADFNQPLDGWNVRRVNTMESMFEDASAFNGNINTWRVSGVGNMNNMLKDAVAFNQPLDQWDLGSVSMQSTFDNASAFDQYLGDWDISSVTNMTNMLNSTALSRINYDNTLIAWSEQNLTPGINLGAQGLLYCDALEERQSMIDTFGWSFFQDVQDCPTPECTQLVAPYNGETDVPVNTNLTWEPQLYAKEYKLTIVIQPAGTIINETVVNDTNYEFPTEFVGGETVHVTIVPSNDTGDAVGPCAEEIFTIASNPPPIPECTNLSSPLNGDTEIAVDTDLSWIPVSNADGYRITVGTTAGGTDILNNLDAGNVTSYDLPTDLPEDTVIFVSIIPYNEQGDATGCLEESFRSELIPVPPACTNLTSPISGTTGVPIDTDLTWNAVPGATGYLVSVGITQNGIEIANSIDVGNTTTYLFDQNLQSNRTHYVTIVPYNDVADAVGCAEESFRTGTSTLNNPPLCTSLASPINGANDVAIDTNISWNASANTDGYYLTIGTSTGATDILNAFDVGNVTAYDLPTDLPENTSIFVTIAPYNVFGSATSCTEESFMTETLATLPACTSLSAPLNGTMDVSVSTDISWNAVSNATGYYLTIGTSTGGNEILDNFDVTNVTSYNLSSNLPEASEIFVTVVPYNGLGSASGCTEESFRTETIPTTPSCTSLINPLQDATDVSVDTNISWNAVSNADGYYLTIGTSSGTSDILDNLDVNNTSTYDLPTDLPETTTIFVTVVPYNSVGNATGCLEESFTTETLMNVPNCTTLTTPLANASEVSVATNLSWNSVSDAGGYYVTVGTSSNTGNILNNEDVGNVTDYDLPTELPEFTTIYVTIVPYNSFGSASGCIETSFTTETLPTIPECTVLTSPNDGDINIALDITLTWEEIFNADGYRLSVGTVSGGNDVIDNEDLGILTSYSFTDRLLEDTTYYVSITPYNSLGDAITCNEYTFTTINQDDTLYGFSPNGDGINDFWTIDGIELSPNNTVSIYNRWGDLVFQVQGYDNQSNVFYGTANKKTQLGASELPSGTYFFNIQVSGTHNLKKTQGFLVLKR